MANRKDYSEIRKKRSYLPEFMVNWGRLPEYLSQANQEIEALQISNTLVGEFEANIPISPGTPLIVGREYEVFLEDGDDFSNVGYIENNTRFIATFPTPLVWVNDSIVQIVKPLTVYYNDIDPNFYVEYFNSIPTIKITNGGFVENKTVPLLPSGAVVLDSNTIQCIAGGRYFKIEVYV